MEYVGGGSVLDLIKKNKSGEGNLKITPMLALKIAVDTCAGMAHLVKPTTAQRI
jgi:serine/threonine protein kinase